MTHMSAARTGACVRWFVLLMACTLGACAVRSPSAGPAGSEAGSVDWQASTFALSTRADHAYRAGRWIDAAQHYGELIERVPDDAYAWFRLANVRSRQGAYDKAVVAYQQSVERNAADPRAWFNLSTAHLVSAQLAMTRSWQAMRAGDPARVLIESRLHELGRLLQARSEDVHSWQARTGSR